MFLEDPSCRGSRQRGDSVISLCVIEKHGLLPASPSAGIPAASQLRAAPLSGSGHLRRVKPSQLCGCGEGSAGRRAGEAPRFAASEIEQLLEFEATICIQMKVI